MMDYTSQFPALAQQANGHRLAYLDSAATAMRPARVLKAVEDFYTHAGANPHRGIHVLGQRATEMYEDARATVAAFINVAPEEVVFVRNASEGFNLLAYSYAPMVLGPKDKVVITIAEHHSNLVPWQQAVHKAGAQLVYMYLNKDGTLPEAEMDKIDANTKIVAFTHVSNVLGCHMPVKQLVQRAKAVGATTVLDCAQSVPHFAMDLRALDVDFASFSGHKMYAPMGIGVLYGKKALLEEMPPFLFGGDMIEYVEEQTTTFAPPPAKFEAGTQNAGAAVGLAEAVRFIQDIGFEEIEKRETELVRYLMEGLVQNRHVKILGNQNPSGRRVGVVAFTVEGVHPHDVASIVDADGVAIRAGHHCAQPLGHYLGVPSSNRASFGIYNTKQDVDALLNALPKTRRMLGYAD